MEKNPFAYYYYFADQPEIEYLTEEEINKLIIGKVKQRAGRSPESNAFLTDTMNTDRKQTNRNYRKSKIASYKYSFQLNEEQNIRFQ